MNLLYKLNNIFTCSIHLACIGCTVNLLSVEFLSETELNLKIIFLNGAGLNFSERKITSCTTRYGIIVLALVQIWHKHSFVRKHSSRVRCSARLVSRTRGLGKW